MNSAGVLCPPGGYPVRLLAARDNTLQGVISRWVATVSATVATEKGTANAHMALYTMPTASGGGDGALIAGTQVDYVGLTSVSQMLTVTVPTSGVAPACYVVRLWVDSINGANPDTVSRDGLTAVANEPTVPVAMVVSSLSVA